MIIGTYYARDFNLSGLNGISGLKMLRMERRNEIAHQ